MPKSFLSAFPAPLKLLRLLPDPDQVTLLAAATTAGPWPCPGCGRPATRIHGHYQRRLADLPWQGRAVSLALEARRLLCPSSNCPRRTFAEPLAEVPAPSPGDPGA